MRRPPARAAALGGPVSGRLTTYLMALATVVLWGASFPLSKAALASVGPTSLAFLRWAISAAALLGWLAWGRRGQADPPRFADAANLWRREWRTVAWMALVGIAAYYWLQNTALRHTTAINAGMLSNLTPLFTVLIAAFMLRERLHLLEWLAAAMAFAGALLVSQGSGHLALGGPGLVGDLLLVVAGLLGALYSIDGKRLAEGYSATVTMALVAAAGAAMLLPLALLEGLRLDLPLPVWGDLLLLGLGAGALANLWWLAILARMKASRAALVLFLIPVFSTALSVVMLHEPITPTVIVGACLVLAGVMVVQRKG